MIVIGLTGGIGTGKSTVSRLFEDLGITIIDTDVIAREVVKPNSKPLQKIIDHFGSAIIETNGELNRKLLRKKIFDNPKDKAWLEQLLHPLIRNEVKKQIKISTSAYCIVVIPLLFETRSYDYLDRILVVDSPIEMQIKRVMERDHSSKEEIEKIIRSQIPSDIKRKKADDIIENNGSIESLKNQVEELHQKYLLMSKKSIN